MGTTVRAQAWAALTVFNALTYPLMEWTKPPTEAELAKFDDQQAAQAGAGPTGRGIFTADFPWLDDERRAGAHFRKSRR